MITEQKPPQATNYDLHLFKMLLEKSKSGFHHKPYSSNKHTVYGYKAVFFIISLLFVIISLHLYSTSISWMAQLIFGGTSHARFFFCTVGLGFSLFSFYYGFKMVPHRELVQGLIKKAKKKARRIYSKKLFFLSYQRIVEASDIKEAEVCWRFAYEDILEELQEVSQKASALLDRIWVSKRLSFEEKEKLFNEALVELENELKSMIANFSKGHALV